MKALVSYNTAPDYIHILGSVKNPEIVIFENIFNPKNPKSVVPTDPLWKHLLSSENEFEKIIIFAGKKSSGALEIIRLALHSIATEKLFFVLCDHDIEEKIALLINGGLGNDSYGVFRDSHTQCREWPILLDYALI